MFCISLLSTDPFFNLAVDDYLLKSSNEEYLILGLNTPSVIIGKHQSAHIESDTEYVTKNNIPVIRRISGGGTVYHDQGNLNFSFISNSSSGRQVDFRKYTLPVIEFLATIGVEAKFEGKNDLRVNGLKVSGNAEHVYRERVLHHGTLLFDSDLEKLHHTLRKDKSCYVSRSVASNPSHVTNLKDCGIKIRTIEEFKKRMLGFFLSQKGCSELKLSGNDTSAISNLAETRYRSWEWNYAYGPGYTFNKNIKIKDENVTIEMSVKNGLITGCSIEGDSVLSNAAGNLSGCRHMPGEIRDKFKKEKISLTDKTIFTFF